MGFMEENEAILMVQHYFDCLLSDDEKERLGSYLTTCSLLDGGLDGQPRFSPAEVEMFCAQCGTVPEFLDLMQSKVLDYSDPSKLLPGAMRKVLDSVASSSASSSKVHSRTTSGVQ